MISDTLSEALDEIEEYEAKMPETYGDPETKAEIAKVKAAMRALMKRLDTPR
jgi:hypothetical protein